jgi:SWI/SNF-related matrix-associated actin-dependent regulator 1 of chromatin subfamily A
MQIVEYASEFRIRIDFNGFRKRNEAAVKRIPGVRYDWKERVWRAPLSQRQNLVELQRYARAKYFKIDHVEPEKFEAIPELPDLDINIPLYHPQGFGLRPYQAKGVARGLQLKRFINGDEPGLGKTLQSIATLHAASLNGEHVYPCLVICPASIKINWEREWKMWAGKSAMILDAKNKDSWHRFYQLGMADVFITNYESLKSFFVTYMPPKKSLKTSKDIIMDDRINIFKSVIVDESHRCKNPQTQQAKLALKICNGKERVILLTGTPVINRPYDLFAQLAIMNRLSHFGGKNGFNLRYCEGGKGSANLKELNYLLNTYCFFRREKKDVAKDLPEKQRQAFLCDITTRSEYNKARDQFVSWLKENGCDDKEVAKKLRGEIMVKHGELRRISALGKINEIKEFIEEVTGSGEKLIVFCNLHAIVDKIVEEFPDAVTVTGLQSSDQKQRAIDSFQNNPKTTLIVCNIKAAGVGITLTASSRVAFIEFPWTYADCVQCEDRAHRIGQTNNVMCTYFLGVNTVDEEMLDLIQNKREIGNTITGGTDEMAIDKIDKLMNLLKK